MRMSHLFLRICTFGILLLVCFFRQDTTTTTALAWTTTTVRTTATITSDSSSTTMATTTTTRPDFVGSVVEAADLTTPVLSNNVMTSSSSSSSCDNTGSRRRNLLQFGLTLPAAIVASGQLLRPKQVCAAETPDTSTASVVEVDPPQEGRGRGSEGEGGLLSPIDIVNLLHPIPTFTIVDQKGVPFTVVGEDAKITAYFFTTYSEAQRILQLASKSADKAIAQAKKESSSKDDDIDVNPWKSARISSIPLDSAVTLVGKSNTRAVGTGNYFKVSPAESDVNDALAVTGKTDLAEGRVPLFYYSNFTIPITTTTTSTTTTQTRQSSSSSLSLSSPLYFQKSQLEQEFRKQNPGIKELPELMVSELFSVLAEMVRPGGTDLELKTLVFVPPRDSIQKKQDCDRKGGKEAAFLLGQRIIVL